ncbi:type VI secretion system protein TssL, long form [Cupriavidus oxalaticus]|uniref:Outer membrane protein n=1 Tax=Cupriavidus oxalaticus TaxID=96344 RepID=A0A375GII5_9BURK|nr:type VI secretion system protein TssL, long form [Cupriavidus oxalaticus]QRQ84460.1 type VI secretion system protein TssL, long form [Cupriavidus oxalaticus]QRQ91452.1 type VI secretion system protein TssL, long form [Cupriavidus oxalaticus]WQD86019.1 type VI secretion system protein TssL, long form [Cupriavidus oxalaticus]SPC19697.1 Outer membrane protein [Cupriavidus oxalaticus]
MSDAVENTDPGVPDDGTVPLSAIADAVNGAASASADTTAPGRAAWRWNTLETPEQRAARIAASANPVLAAAQPLLRALADMPADLPADLAGVGAAQALKQMLMHEIQQFQAVCERANLRREHVLAARYTLCTALDEAANATRWGEAGDWATHSLLIQCHQEGDGGEKVFQLLGRLVASPQEHMHVIELVYQVLSLGFRGRYGKRAEGPRELDAIRQQLLNLIAGARESVPRELSPHGLGAAPGKLRRLRSVPVWITACVLSLGVAALFGWYKYQLLAGAHALAQQIVAIGHAAPPDPPKALRLAALLQAEIARGVVSVSEDDKRSAVTFRGDDMFAAGQVDVGNKVLPVLDKVAAEIGKVAGQVTVIGHTDNVPIRTARFPSNQVLSEERAAVVAEYLAGKGVARGRLLAVGKGDSEPVAGNASAAARAQNRRVEIVVTH